MEPAITNLGITHPDARVDREDGRSARGRLQLQALRDGHLAPWPRVKDQFIVTDLGRDVLQMRIAGGG